MTDQSSAVEDRFHSPLIDRICAECLQVAGLVQALDLLLEETEAAAPSAVIVSLNRQCEAVLKLTEALMEKTV